MTEPESERPLSAAESNVATTPETPEPAAEPAPEPWTAERVTEWNSYYDIYVALGLLLLVFVVAANKISNPSLWTQLRAGQQIVARGGPLVTDVFSYTEEGRRWVNIPWLFEWSHYALYKAAYDLVFDKNDPGASVPKAEQLGAGVLVGLDALVRVFTALVLLAIRRAGPGKWWSAVCVALALGAIVTPAGVALGGIARAGQVSPGAWGLLLLAVEMLLLHRALGTGRPKALLGLVPLFLLWANLDESFLIGLVFLATAVLGLLKRPAGAAVPAPTFARGLAVLAACVAVCLVNPSGVHIFPAAFSPLLSGLHSKSDVRTLDQLSFFSKEFHDPQGTAEARSYVRLLIYTYLLLVAVGIGSFVLNRKRFAPGRFLTFAVAAALWGYLIRFEEEFAVVFAVTLALNGQEWYHDRFGTRGRLGAGWTAWSVGGRAVTIVALFFLVARCLTGYGSNLGETQFGFGFDPDQFEFEAADYLKNSQIKGNVLNTMRHQGDALVWRAFPQRKVYIDNRHNLYPQSVLNELDKIRSALKVDAQDQWQPLLDKYGVSVVMIDEVNSSATYQQLMRSPNWIAFYDDGNAIMFGRADAAPGDVALFKANRLEAEALAFRRIKPTPGVDRPPTQVGWLDEIFQARSLTRSQPHDQAANRWIKGLETGRDTPTLPDPAHCIVALQEARIALSKKPDDPLAYRILSECYRALMIEETALLQGLKLTPENREALARGVRQPLLLMGRFRQRATALNFAIQTTPPPKSNHERQNLQILNNELFQLYLSANFLDLARDRLEAVVSLSEGLDPSQEFRTQTSQQLARLDDLVKKIQDQMNEQQEGPIQRAMLALQNGAPGLAIQELEEADRTNLSPALVKPQLIDLYCDTGQPDKALELLSTGDPNDPGLGGEPGTSALRQARVYLLLGNYENASVLMLSKAIPALRYDRTYRALTQAQFFELGEPLRATSLLLTVPNKIATQATWEFEVANCLLEGGVPLADANHPAGAADHFAKVLTLVPDMSLRPVVAYYLEKLGKPVPPLPTASSKEKEGEVKKDAGAPQPPDSDKKADEVKK